jgi:hypothetical protein
MHWLCKIEYLDRIRGPQADDSLAMNISGTTLSWP